MEVPAKSSCGFSALRGRMESWEGCSRIAYAMSTVACGGGSLGGAAHNLLGLEKNICRPSIWNQCS